LLINRRQARLDSLHCCPWYLLTLPVSTNSISHEVVIQSILTTFAGWTKKTTVAALYLLAYCTGNIIGPQTFRPKDAPEYRPAEITILVCWVVCIIDILYIWWYYRRQNKKKALIRESPGYVKVENQEFLDLTDRENAEFVYSL
jgi:ACS family allantoate permease-like MFS transporter